MKTRKLILAIACVIASSQIAKAQFSARIDVGYGFPSGVQTYTSTSNGTSTLNTYSLGAGFNLAVAGNYMFGDHVGAGLDLNLLFGSPVKETGTSGTSNYTETTTGSLFAITPNVILSANTGKINPYGRFGLVLGVASYTSTTTSSSLSGSDIDAYTGNLAIGWYAGFGVQFPLADRLMLNVELFDRDLTYAPATYTNKQSFNGYPKADSENLVMSTTSTSPSNTVLTDYKPFGSVGIKVGVTLALGK